MDDFKFISEIMELLLKARRALANTYPLRFFMSGAAKKQYFDFKQGELEMSLERLGKLIERDLTSYVEMEDDKSKENSLILNRSESEAGIL